MSTDLHNLDNNEPILTLSEKEQAIIDRINAANQEEDNSDIELPSNKVTEKEKPAEEDKKYAGKYANVDELRKGIKNLDPNTPDYIVNGLNDEALEQYYLEKQKEFSSAKTDRKHSEKTAADNKADENNKQEEPQSTEELWTELEDYYKQNSSISEELYNKMNKAGIPDNIIDKYADRLHQEQVEFTTKVYNIAGGQEKFEAMKAWAEDGNISQYELDAISKMPYDAMLGALHGIKARYDLANPSTQDTTVRLTGSDRINADVYRNQSEYILDVQDKRYGKDKRYTALVDQKFANSAISK